MRARIAAILLACAAPAAAQAHAILVSSQPPPEGHVRPGRQAVVLKFNSRLDPARSKLTLQQGGGPAQRVPISGNHDDSGLAATLDLRPGAYALKWQVLSVDGHVTRGTIPFTVDHD